MKATVAKAVLAFQSTNEYNTILFQWYFKGFELLRKYLVKDGSSVDLDGLDFEVVDKEIDADEAALAVVSTEDPLEANKDDENVPPS